MGPAAQSSVSSAGSGCKGGHQRALASAFSTAEAAESTEAAMLSRFGDLLASHVRFEERELFEAAQSLMAAA